MVKGLVLAVPAATRSLSWPGWTPPMASAGAFRVAVNKHYGGFSLSVQDAQALSGAQPAFIRKVVADPSYTDCLNMVCGCLTWQNKPRR